MVHARVSLVAALTVTSVAGAAAAQSAPPPMTPPPETRALFTADPVIDGAVLSLGGGWAILSSLIIGTGEIRPDKSPRRSTPRTCSRSIATR